MQIDRRHVLKTIFGTLLIPSTKAQPGERVLRLHPNEFGGSDCELVFPIHYALQMLGLVNNKANRFIVEPQVSFHDARRLAAAIESLDECSFHFGLVRSLNDDSNGHHLRELVEFLRHGGFVVDVV